MTTTPPFRADHVGSLLRTAPVKEARARREKGEIGLAELKVVEDREIEKIVSEAEVGRSSGRDRWRVPPRLVAFRFLRHARRC
jgi:5-methyltetrahydropteroyltriglutamate--homocysteine methyltransferase